MKRTDEHWLKQLRETALAATPGPWHYTTCYGVAFIEAKNREAIAHAVEYLNPPNADYIARFNPQTALLICDVLEAARIFNTVPAIPVKAETHTKRMAYHATLMKTLDALRAHLEAGK